MTTFTSDVIVHNMMVQARKEARPTRHRYRYLRRMLDNADSSFGKRVTRKHVISVLSPSELRLLHLGSTVATILAEYRAIEEKRL